jgi:hypothetical protein
MHPSTDRRRGRRILRAVAPTVAAAGVAALGMAAFTDDARNDGNRASAASVTITEDVPASSRLFDLKGWQPGEDGSTVSRCIAVTNDGSIALPLRLRLDGASTGALGDHIDMKIERGARDAATDTSDCSSFAPAEADATVYDAELDEFPTAAGAGVPDKGGPLAVDAERAYRVTWSLQDSEAAEGLSIADVDFLWETTTAD